MQQDTGIRLGVLGLGHVGLPTTLGFAELGWPVVGADDDLEKAEGIARGEVPFYEPGLEDLLRKHLRSEQFRVVPESTVLFLCVGTPQREDWAAIDSFIRGKRLLVTGAAGSVGSELSRQLARHNPNLLLLVDQAENLLFFLESEIRSTFSDTPLVAQIACHRQRHHAPPHNGVQAASCAPRRGPQARALQGTGPGASGEE